MNRIFFAENLIRLRLTSLFRRLLAGALLALPAVDDAWAQAPPADSARLSRRPHRLGEVRVRAIGPERFAVGSTRTGLDSAVLAQYRGSSLAEVLQARTPLALKYYGPGQLATIALRGTSAQHTAVLWNGLNIMLPTLGQTDFALLPVGASTRVSIQPGPAAALYGSGAVGGAILLDAAPDWRGGQRGSVQLDAGSFGLFGGNVEMRAASAAVAVRVAASYREARNNYSYQVQEARGPVRYSLQNAALRHQWSFSPDLAWRVGRAGELTAAAWLTDTDREIQSGTGIVGGQARERDQSTRLTLGYRHLAARGQWSGRVAWFDDVLNYRDRGAPSNSRVRTTQAQAEHTAALGTRGSLRLGAEAQHFEALVDGYGAVPIAENRAAAFALLRYDPRPALRLSANLRQAALPAGLAPLTPTLGAEWDLLPAAATDSVAAAVTKNPAAQSLIHPFTHSPLLRQQPLAGGELDKGGRVAGLGFVHDVLAVGFDGALTGEKALGDFGVGEAVGHQGQHFHLALAQAQRGPGNVALGRAARVEARQQRQANGRAQKWPARRHRAQRVHQLGGQRGFEQVAVRPKVDGAGHVVLVGELAAGHNAQVRLLLAQGGQQAKGIGPGQGQVEQQHGGRGGSQRGQQLGPGAGFGHYRKARRGLQPEP